VTDLVFVSLEGWDAIWRRNQFVVAELARRRPEMRVLFVGPPRDVSNALRHRNWAQLRERADFSPGGLSNVTVTAPLKLLPNSWGWGRRVNEWLLRRHVTRAMRRLGISRPVLWLNPHWAVHLVGRMGEAGVIYDITDDWISLTQEEWLRELTRAQDAELCGKADAVIVCSERLYEMKREATKRRSNEATEGVEWGQGDKETGGQGEGLTWGQGDPSPRPSPGVPGEGGGDRLFLIPNGVDAEHYRGVLEGRGELPEVARGWRRPVFGYTGTIHPDRVDVGLVERLARAVLEERGGSVVLIGPSHLSEGDRARLERVGNVHFVGPVAYRGIPEVMRGFDVCIVPHRVTDFTESLNPIKLWEYLAAGLPIVSTDVAGFRDYPDLVRVGRTGEEFVRACLEEGRERQGDTGTRGQGEMGEGRWEMGNGNRGRGLAEARRAEARRHSWVRRVDEIERVIEAVMEGRRAGANRSVDEVGAAGRLPEPLARLD
jgi:teichuronic acid biosynthesis glycosyltransferase TuaH